MFVFFYLCVFHDVRNLFIVWLLTGIWHGAAWNYVVWGGLRGVYQILEDLSKPVREKVTTKLHVDTKAFSHKFGQILITFFLTTLCGQKII